MRLAWDTVEDAVIAALTGVEIPDVAPAAVLGEGDSLYRGGAEQGTLAGLPAYAVVRFEGTVAAVTSSGTQVGHDVSMAVLLAHQSRKSLRTLVAAAYGALGEMSYTVELLPEVRVGEHYAVIADITAPRRSLPGGAAV